MSFFMEVDGGGKISGEQTAFSIIRSSLNTAVKNITHGSQVAKLPDELPLRQIAVLG